MERISWDADSIHPGEEYKYPSEEEADFRKDELARYGIRCVRRCRDGEWLNVVASTPTECDQALLREYFDEPPSWTEADDD